LGGHNMTKRAGDQVRVAKPVLSSTDNLPESRPEERGVKCLKGVAVPCTPHQHLA